MKRFGIDLTLEYSLNVPAFNRLIGDFSNHEAVRNIFRYPIENGLRIFNQNVDSNDCHQVLNTESIFHQFLHRVFDILALRKDEILQLRCITDEGVGGADAANGCVEVFEKLV